MAPLRFLPPPPAALWAFVSRCRCDRNQRSPAAILGKAFQPASKDAARRRFPRDCLSGLAESGPRGTPRLAGTVGAVSAALLLRPSVSSIRICVVPYPALAVLFHGM